jgi:outer membrane lipoprotein-sorting protein
MLGATFAIYREQQGGTALWSEVQNIEPDKDGSYTVLLGATTNDGVPVDLFASGEPRWLEVQFHLPERVDQPRVLLVSVPYALKASDADTLGGLPASAFLQVGASTSDRPAIASPVSPQVVPGTPDAACTSITSDGTATVNQVTKFTAPCKVEPSAIFESGGKVGIGTTTPTATLDVKGSSILRGVLTMNSKGAATSAAGSNSNPIDMLAASFSSSLATSISQHYRWQAEAAGNNTATPSGTLNLLYAPGSGAPAETGLSINSQGLVTFAASQAFPGAGTITGVNAGAGLSGGGAGGSVTLNNTGVLAVGVGTGISETGAGNSPVLSLNTAFTDGRYLQLGGGALSGGLGLPANGLAAGSNQLVLSGGNVGIGTATPGALLEVAGNVKISGTGSTLTFPDGSTQRTAVSPGTDGVIAVNPQQVAPLKWFPAYQSAATFPVGNSPSGMAFDGANIWVADTGSNTVTKLRASDGTNLGAFLVGASPYGVAFDGANIWVTSGFSNTVTKLRASDGACAGTCTFGVGVIPYGVAFDGADVWVTNTFGDSVTKLRASDGACVGSCTFSVGVSPHGVAFDGSNIWVTNAGSNTLTKLRASDGANLGTLPVGAAPSGVAFDGANIWVSNSSSNTVTKLLASDGACVGTCTFSVGSGPNGVAFDGASIWVANSSSNTVTKLRASDGACVGTCTFNVGTGKGNDPTAHDARRRQPYQTGAGR